MQDIREFPGVHSVAPPSRYPRAGASRSYHSSSSSPGPGDGFRNRDDDDDEHERAGSLTGSAHQSSDPDEAVFEATSQHSSPGTSHHSDDDDDDDAEMSEFPPDLPVGEDATASAISQQHQHFSSPYTPHKIRSPFRNPSSVRAMQMDTTPPHLTSSPSSQQRYSITAPSRNGTLRSIRSSHSAVRSPSKLSSPIKKLKKEYPLVLLHVTLLPIPIPYSPAVMESVLPQYILENWKLLRQKATPTVLDRGILIPHPKEDYDLLEERLLESLELKTPRILKCGHFHLSPEEEADIAGSDGCDSDEDEDAPDADICDDCGRRIRDGRFGSGTGSKRWDIKLFAANGLMRAGAWGAAWREMERVDVEIVPWMDEELKRQVELRSLEEAEAAAAEEEAYLGSSASTRARAHAGTGAAAIGNQSRRGGGGDVARDVPNPNPSLSPGPGMDEARMREIYGEDIAQAYLVDEEFNRGDADDGNDNSNANPSTYTPTSLHHHQNHQHPPDDQRQHQHPHQHQRQRQQIPLPLLLKNYIYLLVSSQDTRNLAIGFLSFLVLLLTLRIATTTTTTSPPQPGPQLQSVQEPGWTYDNNNNEAAVAKDWHHQQQDRRERDDKNPSVLGLSRSAGSGIDADARSVSVSVSSIPLVSVSGSVSDSPQSLISISIAIPSPSPSSSSSTSLPSPSLVPLEPVPVDDGTASSIIED